MINALALERVTPELRGLVQLACKVAALPRAKQLEVRAGMSPATHQALRDLKYEWPVWARTNQLAPAPPWRWWVMTGGRGSGKTRSASEQVIRWAKDNPGIRIAMVGSDAGNVRKVMLNGRSGILTRAPRWFQPKWWKTDKLVEWPNGSVCELHTSEEPRTLRGPEYHRAWIEELFHWTIARGEKAPTAFREGIKFGLRLGGFGPVQGIVTSSPRSTEFCHEMLLGKKDDATGRRPIGQAEIDSGEWTHEETIEDEDGGEHTYRIFVSRWSSEENAANLSPGQVAEWRAELKGTRLERQELDGDILAKVEGALWSTEILDFNRVLGVPRIARTLVAVDPTRSDAPVDEAGIMVGGLGDDGHGYVWEDRSCRGSPLTWATRAVEALRRSGAGAIVYEANRLPEKTRAIIRSVDPNVRWVPVQATDGKRTRAEPVSALYERGLVHHVGDKEKFERVEDEMISWDPRARMPSPNRMDALVWLITALMLSDRKELKHL